METQGSVLMSRKLCKGYIAHLRRRYRNKSKNEKSEILKEAQSHTGLHRKSLIRALKEKPIRDSKKRPGAKKRYDEDCSKALRELWRKTDQMCSKKLVAAMPSWVRSTQFSPETKAKLLKMSASTMDRLLKPYKAKYRRQRRSGTKPGSLLKDLIPLKSLGNIASGAGMVEADTVAHCGGSLLGDFIWSLNITDQYSGWTESRGVWGKHAKNIHAAIEEIEQGLPFEITGFNVDNGSEFLNHRLKEYLSEHKKGGPKHRKRFVMTRSRSYYKNDNAHVEQKNWTHIRQLFGYERFDFKDLLPLMNEIYKVNSLLQNFFHPQMKLKSKQRKGKKWVKKYHPPKTPYARLLEDKAVTEESKSRLKEINETLNPFKLVEKREELLTQFYKLKRKLESERNRVKETPKLKVLQ